MSIYARRHLKVFAFILFTFSSTSSYASKSTITGDAINCAALFYILTSNTMDKPKLAAEMTNATIKMGAIYAVYEKNTTGKRITNGDVSRLRDIKAKELGAIYDNNITDIFNQTSYCVHWNDSISAYTNKNGENLDILKIPALTKNINTKLTSEAKKNITASFDTWAKWGKPSQEDIKNQVQEFVDKNKK